MAQVLILLIGVYFQLSLMKIVFFVPKTALMSLSPVGLALLATKNLYAASWHLFMIAFLIECLILIHLSGVCVDAG
ncbi:hypothetical protein KR100_01565 [Synechococcus sp. KORDI-100]|nr:hypothetical protein KR100_01565 [Synechococcus sp. KORDI-100]